MRPGTTEHALMICFAPSILAHEPLGTKKRLLNPNFPVPISIVFGDDDWIKDVEEDAGE